MSIVLIPLTKWSLTQPTLGSVYGYTIHNPPRHDGDPIIRVHGLLIAINAFLSTLILRFGTADHDHRALQSDDGPHVWHIHRASQVSRDLSLSTRFDFNVYSYESEWTMGAEWWLRRSRSKPVSDGTADDTSALSEAHISPYDVTGVVKARASTSNVGFFLCIHHDLVRDLSPNLSVSDAGHCAALGGPVEERSG